MFDQTEQQIRFTATTFSHDQTSKRIREQRTMSKCFIFGIFSTNINISHREFQIISVNDRHLFDQVIHV